MIKVLFALTRSHRGFSAVATTHIEVLAHKPEGNLESANDMYRLPARFAGSHHQTARWPKKKEIAMIRTKHPPGVNALNTSVMPNNVDELTGLGDDPGAGGNLTSISAADLSDS